MNPNRSCPVCDQLWGASCRELPTYGPDTSHFECEVGGNFQIRGTVFATTFHPENCSLTEIQRAAMSHILCTRKSKDEPSIIDTNWVSDVLSSSTLPDPITRATNAIRYIGDEVSNTGSAISKLNVQFSALIGAPNYHSFTSLLTDLANRNLIRIGNSIRLHGYTIHHDVDLTLQGWEKYQDPQLGRVSSGYGFIAMQFSDSILDPFVEEVVKPAVKNGTGYELVHMRDVGRAGIIDNIMRAQIRDAAFVIADLTHDNSGAYWEAGYAEGLGKPVIYICERDKFKKNKTHFDTNHCTTVVWSASRDCGFEEELISTLRRSLNIPPRI